MATVSETIVEQSVHDFKALGVLKEGHFERHDGKHTRWYFHSHPLFYTGALWRAVQDLVAVIPLEVLDQIDIVAGPQFAGNVIAQGMINIISSNGPMTRESVHCVPIEKQFKLVGSNLGKTSYHVRRFYQDVLPDKKVLLVDDVVASGKTIVKCVRLLESMKARVIASVCIANLSHVKDATQYSIWNQPPNHADVYDRGSCPMCKSDDPEIRKITKF